MDLASMAWRGFSTDEITAIRTASRAAGFTHSRRGQRLTELPCPHCGNRSLRTYLHIRMDDGNSVLLSQMWCSRCERFTGSTGPTPDGIRFVDPITPVQHAKLGVPELFRELDRLWSQGVLPQTLL
jgi:hypothetical protein